MRFLDCRDGQMRSGKVVAMHNTQVVLHELATEREWKLPYAAIEPPATSAVPAPAEALTPPTVPLPQRGDFRCGDKVAYEDRNLTTQVGIITCIDQRTATLDTGNGHSGRIGFGLLCAHALVAWERERSKQCYVQ